MRWFNSDASQPFEVSTLHPRDESGDAERLAAECYRGAIGSALLLDEGRCAAFIDRLERLSGEQVSEEFFAALTLARARRYNGTHHLSLRILSALDGVCMPLWRGWLDWEMAMVSGPPVNDGAGALAQAAQAFRSSLTRAEDLQMRPSIFCDEAAEALAATIPQNELSDGIAAWGRGEVHVLPAGLSGISSEDDTTWVWAAPNTSPRRFLALTAPTRFGHSLHEGKGGRVHEALSILLLAGAEGMDKSVFFKSAYGFDYVSALHSATFKVLRHRMRQRLEGAGTLVAEGNKLVIRLQRPVVVPDPRSGHSFADRVLRVLSRTKAGSAKSASAALNVPLRSVQATLKELVENGDCVPTRDGRKQSYRVEDTTFSEPSIRLRRQHLE